MVRTRTVVVIAVAVITVIGFLPLASALEKGDAKSGQAKDVKAKEAKSDQGKGKGHDGKDRGSHFSSSSSSSIHRSSDRHLSSDTTLALLALGCCRGGLGLSSLYGYGYGAYAYRDPLYGYSYARDFYSPYGLGYGYASPLVYRTSSLYGGYGAYDGYNAYGGYGGYNAPRVIYVIQNAPMEAPIATAPEPAATNETAPTASTTTVVVARPQTLWDAFGIFP